MCAVADGLAYLVRVDAPEAGAVIAHDQVSQVVAVPGARLLLLVRSIDIVAIGAGGVVWRSSRLAVDDLRVARVGSEGIHCAAGMLGDSPERVMVDPETGRVSAGPRLDGPPWN